MKYLRNKLHLSIASIVVALIIMGAGMNEESSDGRSGHNGSPGEQTCAKSNCHNTFTLNSGEGEVVISAADLVNWNYQPGQTYQISLTVSQTGIPLFGFGFEALDEQGNNAGTLTPGTDNHALFAMVSGVNRKTITHLESSGLAANSKTWNFTWTAPMDPIMVTFYAVGNAANNNGGRTGDYVYSTSQVVMPEISNVNPPVINASGPLTLCEGSSVQLSVTSQPGVQHQWFNNGVNVSQGDAFLATDAGCYTVEAISANDTVLSQNQVCVEVTAISNEIIITSGTLSAVQNADSYQWLNCDEGNIEIPGANEQTYAPSNSGNYAVELTLNGCTVISDCISLLTNNSYLDTPAKKALVQFNSFIKELVIFNNIGSTIDVIDIGGKIVFSGQNPSNIRLNTTSWPEGIYFVRSTTNKKCTTTKVLIH